MKTTRNQQLSFLNQPPFSAKFPNKKTLPSEVLERLLKGERLTQPSFGLTRWRLGSYIKSLDYMGWTIERCDVPNPHGEHPIREYWLSPETICAAQELRGHHGR